MQVKDNVTEHFVALVLAVSLLVCAAPSAADDGALWRNSAEILQGKGDWAGALRHALRWTEEEPDSYEAWYYLGVVYGQLGQSPNEISAYEQTLRIDPSRAYSWRNLGLLYERTGQYAKAVEAYQEALQLQPSDASIQGSLRLTKQAYGFWRFKESDCVDFSPPDTHLAFQILERSAGQALQLVVDRQYSVSVDVPVEVARQIQEVAGKRDYVEGWDMVVPMIRWLVSRYFECSWDDVGANVNIKGQDCRYVPIRSVCWLSSLYLADVDYFDQLVVDFLEHFEAIQVGRN